MAQETEEAVVVAAVDYWRHLCSSWCQAQHTQSPSALVVLAIVRQATLAATLYLPAALQSEAVAADLVLLEVVADRAAAEHMSRRLPELQRKETLVRLLATETTEARERQHRRMRMAVAVAVVLDQLDRLGRHRLAAMAVPVAHGTEPRIPQEAEAVPTIAVIPAVLADLLLVAMVAHKPLVQQALLTEALVAAAAVKETELEATAALAS